MTKIKCIYLYCHCEWVWKTRNIWLIIYVTNSSWRKCNINDLISAKYGDACYKIKSPNRDKILGPVFHKKILETWCPVKPFCAKGTGPSMRINQTCRHKNEKVYIDEKKATTKKYNPNQRWGYYANLSTYISSPSSRIIKSTGYLVICECSSNAVTCTYVT